MKKHKNQLIPYKGTDSNTSQPMQRSYSYVDIHDTSLTPESSVSPEEANTQNREEERSDNCPQVPETPINNSSVEDIEREEFVEASADNGVSHEEESQNEYSSRSRAGQSKMSLRPLPRVNYKPFFCLNI